MMLLLPASWFKGGAARREIGKSLAGLIAIAVVPLLVLIAYVASTYINHEKAEVGSDLTHIARALRVAVDRELLNQLPAMEILATDVSLDRGDQAQFMQRARRAIEVHRDWRSVSLIDPKTYAIVASTISPSSQSPTTLAPRGVDQVLKERKPLVAGAFRTGILTTEPMILLLAPVMRKDEVLWVMSVAMNTTVMNEVFSEQGLPRSWTGAVVDNNLRIAGRSREPKRFVGSRITPSLEQHVTAANSGMFTALTQEGGTVNTVFDRSPLTGWSVVIGIPDAEIDAPIGKLLRQLALAGGVLIGLALIMSAAMANKIARRRNEYERDLLASENRFRRLTHLSADWYWEQDENLRFTFISPGIEVQHRAIDQMLGKTCWELPHFDTEPQVQRENEALLAAHLPFKDLVLKRMGLDQEFHYAQVSGEPVFDEQGRFNGYSGVGSDITERKRLEQELEQYFRFFRLSTDPMCIADPFGCFKQVNPAFTQLTGYSDGELVARPFLDFVLPEDRQRTADEMKLQVAERPSLHFENRYVCKDGRAILLSWTAYYDKNDGVTYATARDLTELRRAEDRLEQFFTLVPDLMCIASTDGYFLKVNPAWRAMLGYAEQEILATPFIDFVHPEDRLATIEARGRQDAGEAILNFVNRYRCKDGSYRWLEWRATPALDQELIFSVARDITERKQAEAKHARLEAQLRESQKMEALGTMAGGVAHDFNNALAMIIGNVELARQDVGPGHAALVSLDEIGKASRRAKDLVQQILSFGRRQKLERKATSLALVVVESARLVRATLPARVSLKVNCEADTPAALADAAQVKQILLNLCGNALHAVQDQGRPGVIEVNLSAYASKAGEAQANLKPGRYACLSVRDNGCGMDAATRAHIFEPFFTTKPLGKGTGLGLSVVHGIVTAHEAGIEVESIPGAGSTFRIYFPAIDAPVEAHAATKPEAAPVLGAGKHVLYVDDEEAIIFLMTRLLERQGFRVSGYTDPREAVAAVRADPDDFDLAVTDYNMPAMSGLEVASALREIRSDLPVVLASGYITEDLRHKAPAAGVRELIYKPNTVDDLCEAVARAANARIKRLDHPGDVTQFR